MITAARKLKDRSAAQQGHIPGEPGIWILIFGDLTVFASLFAMYLTYRRQDPVLFAESQNVLNRDFGAINTLLLLTSSILVVMAIRAIREGIPRIPTAFLAGALGCGLGFCISKAIEYQHILSHHYTPATNSFFMCYFVLTGLHLAHVIVGMAVLAGLLILSRRPRLSSRQFGYAEAGGCFWHMVDALWLVLFPLLYLVR